MPILNFIFVCLRFPVPDLFILILLSVLLVSFISLKKSSFPNEIVWYLVVNVDELEFTILNYPFLQCLYEAGKYSGVRLLDLFCEALNQVLYPSRDSVCSKRDEKDHGLSSTNDPCQQYSIMQSGGSICQIVRKVR